MAQASFVRAGEELVAPFSLNLAAGETITLDAPDARAATIVARLCAAMVKPTLGTIYVGEFETRLQPPQAKRLVGFVDAAGFVGDAYAFRCEVAFRAEVWGLERDSSMQRARHVVASLASVGEPSFTNALALALVADVRLVVLDRPPLAALEAVRELVPRAGIVCVRSAASELAR